MTIIFLHPKSKKLYICTETEVTRVVTLDDPDLLKYIPNDDILYVENGHIIQKDQFATWLQGGVIEEPLQKNLGADFDTGFRFNTREGATADRTPQRTTSTAADPNRLYIHTTNPGTVLIDDIQTERFPEGIELNNKYQFVSINSIGEDVLEESHKFRWLMAKNKVEVVNEIYVKKHQHKQKTRSAADRALDAILIKNDRRGSAWAAAEGGYYQDEGDQGGAIPIYVE